MVKLKKIVFEGDCPKLELLDLSGNQLTEFNLPIIFKKLEYLYLGGNEQISNIPNFGSLKILVELTDYERK